MGADAGRILLGSIASAHGIRGDVLIRSLTTNPEDIAAYGPVTDETGRRQFEIWYRRGDRYEPDFVVETATEKLICEVKARRDMESQEVQAKAKAARIWVGHANDHARATGRKPWRYALIPDDAVTANATLAGLMATYGLEAVREDAVAA